MRTAIVTDSNSGIFEKEGRKLGIYVVPMPVIIQEMKKKVDEFHENGTELRVAGSFWHGHQQKGVYVAGIGKKIFYGVLRALVIPFRHLL